MCWAKPIGAKPYVQQASRVMTMCTKVIQYVKYGLKIKQDGTHSDKKIIRDAGVVLV